VWQQQAGVRPCLIGELPDGEVGRIMGTVRAHARTLTAPLSGRACVYYMVLVEQAGAINMMLRDGVALALEDTSGRAIIEPAAASVAVLLDHREQARSLHEATSSQDAVLARNGYDIRGAGELVFYEAVVEVGERVTVVGAGLREPTGVSSQETDFRTPPPLQLHIASSNAAQLSIASHRAH